jgi:transcriptional regulator with XRE-family HTH domain
MNLSDRIQLLITQNNTSQSELEKTLGFGKGTISKWKGKTAPSADKLQLIADHFGVTIDYLMTGREYASDEPMLNARDEKDIQKHLDMFREQLMSQEGLMFNGDPASPEAIESILQAMEVGMALAKKKNKERFTPKKYRKKD